MIRTFLKKYIFQISLVMVVGLLFFANYEPNTYLLGWDGLQTELNPLLGVKRAVFSVWEEYQSFGLLAGMAHAADFVRALVTALLGLVLPQSLVRYTYHFGMLAIGAVGMFTLLETALPIRKRLPYFSFIGALFYILNYATVQMMSVPFEPFSTFLAFLPWNIWIFIRFLRAHRKSHVRNNLIFFAIINFLATPQAYVQTLFVVYGLVLGLISIAKLITERYKKQALKRIIVAGLVILGVNAFWLLPQTYFVATGGAETVQNAKINQLATENVTLQNKEYGTLESLATYKGFYSSLEDSQKQPLFGPWLEHFQSPVVRILGIFFFAALIIGVFQATHHQLAMLLVLGVAGAAQLSNVPGLDFVHTTVRSLPLIGEIFRAPFTKFAIPYALAASYFVTFGLIWMYNFVGKRLSPLFTALSQRMQTTLGYSALLLVLVAYTLPAFRGVLIANDMRVAIPQDYLATIEFFNKEVEPNKRIALLPDYTFWGWYFTSWGYNGSGFLWYGIEQPIVSRTFDVWSVESEGYFWEMKTAVESEDILQVENVLEKYGIDYLIVDTSIRPINGSVKALQYDRLSRMFENSAHVKQIGFGEHLNIYTFSKGFTEDQNFIMLGSNLRTIGPSKPLMHRDFAFEHFGTYVSNVENPEVLYPYRDIFTQTRLTGKRTPAWTLEEFEDGFVVNNPSFDTLRDSYIDVNEFRTNVEKQPVSIPPLEQATVYPCGRTGDEEVFFGDEFVRIFSNQGAVPCLSYNLQSLNQSNGYLLKISTRNIDGQRLFISLTDNTKDQSIIEERLTENTQYFMIPAHYEFGRGYTLTFQNTSYTDIPSTNIIEAVEVYEFPVNDIAQKRLIRPETAVQYPLFITPTETRKRAYHAYTTDMTLSDLRDSSYLILQQSYHPGWHAYVVSQSPITERFPYIFGLRIRDHVRINQWAQGWDVSKACEGSLLRSKNQECRVVMLFIPQYLQWLGFAVLGAVGVGVYMFVKRSKNA